MSVQVLLPLERHVTECALKGPLVTVNLHVSLQLPVGSESLVADLAKERRLGVGGLVFYQALLVDKGGIAQLAGMGLFTQVLTLHVGLCSPYDNGSCLSFGKGVYRQRYR